MATNRPNTVTMANSERGATIGPTVVQEDAPPLVSKYCTLV
jgi:hypothetical protein